MKFKLTTWAQVLDHTRLEGSSSGARATVTLARLPEQARDAPREGRNSGLKAGQAHLDVYTALVSGVLLGMSDSLQVPQARKGHALT